MDMRLFDEAYDRLWETDDIAFAKEYVRKYFSGDSTEQPIWEIASDRRTVAVRDVSELLS